MRDSVNYLNDHVVELALDGNAFPDGTAFAWLVVGLSTIGAIEAIELGIAPDGGGRLAFVLHTEASAQELRSSIATLAGASAILVCGPREP